MKTAEEIIEALIFSDEMVLDTVGEDIRFVSANDAIRAMKEYASQSQGNKDLIIEKQGELIEIYRSYYSCLQKIDKNKVTQLESELEK